MLQQTLRILSNVNEQHVELRGALAKTFRQIFGESLTFRLADGLLQPRRILPQLQHIHVISSESEPDNLITRHLTVHLL